jgi:outer membrane protein
MRKNFLLFLLCVLPFAVSAQNANVKLGYVDVQTLFYSMPETVEADSAIQKSARMHEAEVKKMEDEYTKKLIEYKEGEKTWDETIAKNRQEELQTLQVRMQNYYQQAQSSLQQKQQQLQVPILEKLRKAILEVGNEEGFLYIFDLNTLQFKSNSAIDATPLVQRKLGIKVLKNIQASQMNMQQGLGN